MKLFSRPAHRALLDQIKQRDTELTTQRAEYDRYRLDAQSRAQEADLAIADLRADLVHADSRIIELASQLDAARCRQREISLSYVGAPGVPRMPAPVQALVDWYLRAPCAAVMPLPSRDSVRTALEAWRAAVPAAPVHGRRI